jgi:hypothetical protein
MIKATAAEINLIEENSPPNPLSADPLMNKTRGRIMNQRRVVRAE